MPIFLCGLLYFFRANAAAAVGNFLVIRDTLEPADLVLLLNGDPNVRPQLAASLWGKGLAPYIAIARQQDSPGVKAGAYPNPTDTNVFMLRSLGVPEAKIIRLTPPDGVSHTFDEAKALLSYAREHSLSKVIVVTSDLHSRRAAFIFRRVFSGSPVRIMMAPVPDLKYGASNWWTVEDGVIGCQNEYLKLVYYHLKY
ncbi:MAG: YdcF family protein [Candidatus Solibacter sp.]